ncbi:MAG TPA: hypothetical protein VFC44_11455 [Candidatus Saccharimonadales bacterium]|nr:hypothetical protein [Candidatus Saccharimonadales bacterium]
MKLLRHLLLPALLGFAGVAWADCIPIAVDNFNLPYYPSGFVTLGAGNAFGNNNNWQVTQGSIDVVGTSAWQSPDGNQTIDMDGLTEGQIQTTINVPFAGTVDINFWLSGNPQGPPMVKTLSVSLGSASDSYTFNVDGHDDNNMGWTMETAVFTDQLAGPETLTFTSLDSVPGNLYGPAIGTVSACAMGVPDNGSTALLLGMVLAGGALWQALKTPARLACQKLPRRRW